MAEEAVVAAAGLPAGKPLRLRAITDATDAARPV